MKWILTLNCQILYILKLPSLQNKVWTFLEREPWIYNISPSHHLQKYSSKLIIRLVEYKGNRWDYESSVNDIGWKLCAKNRVLIGKRGLLQRAVDRFIL